MKLAVLVSLNYLAGGVGLGGGVHGPRDRRAAPGGHVGQGGVDGLRHGFCLLSFQRPGHLRPELVHVLAVLGPPVHHVGVVGGDAPLIALAVADKHAVLQRVEVVQLAQVGHQVHGITVDVGKVGSVAVNVVAHHRAALVGVAGGLTQLHGDMRVVGALPTGAGACVPPSPVPGQELGDTLSPYDGVGGHLHAGGVPGLDKYVGVRLGHPEAVHHDTLGLDNAAGTIAVVARQEALRDVRHCCHPSA